MFVFQRCAFCKHLGATIKCCEEKCTQMYHYPCAAGAGTFQDFSNLSLLCPDHIDQAPERCKYTVFIWHNQQVLGKLLCSRVSLRLHLFRCTFTVHVPKNSCVFRDRKDVSSYSSVFKDQQCCTAKYFSFSDRTWKRFTGKACLLSSFSSNW